MIQALGHQNRDVRVSALRLSERWIAQPNHRIQGEVLKRLDDADWAVRRQLAATLGELPPGSKETALANASRALRRRSGRNGRGDQRHAAAASWPCSSACCRELGRLLNGPLLSPCWLQRSSEPATMQRCRRCSPAFLKRHERPGRGPRSCSGAEVALLGATMPGTPARGAVDPNAPCETCPGGRGGPGGARAFPGALAGANPPAPPARAGGPFVTLSREPALIAVAAGDGELAESRGQSARANRLARETWRGTGCCAADACRTEAVYSRPGNLQEPLRRVPRCRWARATGRSAQHRWLRNSHRSRRCADPRAASRQGGAVGLMPAHGETLSDEEIAAVLTYVRRAWGQAGAPIDAGGGSADQGRHSRSQERVDARRARGDQMRIQQEADRSATLSRRRRNHVERPKVARYRAWGWGPTTNQLTSPPTTTN